MADLTRTQVISCLNGKANFCGVDLSGLDLSGLNFSEANLEGANLTGANLDGATLPAALPGVPQAMRPNRLRMFNH